MGSKYDELKKQYGDGKMSRASDIQTVDVISSGSIALDYATGVGGFPLKSIIEIYGRSSVGKTTLMYYTIAAAQRAGLGTGYVNLEGNFDPIWAKRTAGVDLENLWMARPNLGTEAIEMLIDMIRTDELRLVVFDSIGTMMNDSELEKSDSKIRAGGQAMMVQHMVKLATQAVNDHNCCVVFLNQVRDVIGSHIPNLVDSPGGKAKEHNAAMRILLKKGERFSGKIEGDQIEVGFRVAAQVKKNKAGSPNRKAYWNFWNYPNDRGVIGIDTHQEILDLAVQKGIIERKGAWFSHPLLGDKTIQGSEKVFEHFRENPEDAASLKDELMTHAYQTMKAEMAGGVQRPRLVDEEDS